MQIKGKYFAMKNSVHIGSLFIRSNIIIMLLQYYSPVLYALKIIIILDF